MLVLAQALLTLCECLLLQDTRLCEEIGLWGTADSDGTVELRLQLTGAPDERYMLDLMPGKLACSSVCVHSYIVQYSGAGHSCCVRR